MLTKSQWTFVFGFVWGFFCSHRVLARFELIAELNLEKYGYCAFFESHCFVSLFHSLQVHLVLNLKMPDYLGDDMRKSKKGVDQDDDDKPFQGICRFFSDFLQIVFIASLFSCCSI